MDVLERINREYERREKIIDNQLVAMRRQRVLERETRREEKIKDLVRQITLAFLTLLLLVIAVWAIVQSQPSFKTSEWDTEIYIVESGDTIWDIGEEVAGNTDIRLWVSAVLELNDMHSSRIYPNDIITIYVPKEGQ